MGVCWGSGRGGSGGCEPRIEFIVKLKKMGRRVDVIKELRLL